jgi:hypothetical protein
MIFKFIINHLGTHFALRTLLEAGIMECLILYLGSKNGEKALTLLSMLDEVAFDYNNHIEEIDLSP